jgi:hypothetical protein
MFETSFGAVEKALLQSHRIPDALAGAFRARITSLQKQGLFGPKHRPGRGVALTYGPDQFHRLVFACELLEFGIGPAAILGIVETLWERKLRDIFTDAEQPAQHHEKAAPDDVIMHMGGIHLLTDVWQKAVPNVNRCRLRELPYYIKQWMTMGPDDPVPPRALVVNLSQRLRAFHAGLAASHLDDLVERQRTSGEIEMAKPRRRGRAGGKRK